MDEIIHLGEFWDEKDMVKHRTEILKINGEISRIFARAYRYLKAARQIYDDSAAINALFVNEAEINKLIGKFTRELFNDIPLSVKVGKQRCLFASAITPDGLVNYLDDLMVTKNIIMLSGFPGAGTERVLERIMTAALERGMDTEAYYCALNPEKLEHLVIPGLDTAITTVNGYHHTDACALYKVNFENMLDKDAESAYKPEHEYNQTEIDRLLNKAVDIIHGAKALHDELETYYVPNMNFDALQKKWEETLSRILAYAGVK